MKILAIESSAKAASVAVLEDGKIAGIGEHEHLLSCCSVYREIYDSQFRREAEA